MYSVLRVVPFATALALMAEPAFARQGPKLLDIDGFIAKGVFTELDAELVKHRLSLREIEDSHFDGKTTDINDVLGLMARYEKLRPRVDEPLLSARGNSGVSAAEHDGRRGVHDVLLRARLQRTGSGGER